MATRQNPPSSAFCKKLSQPGLYRARHGSPVAKIGSLSADEIELLRATMAARTLERIMKHATALGSAPLVAPELTARLRRSLRS